MNSKNAEKPGRIKSEANSSEEVGNLDSRILGLLQEDSRLSFNKVAARLGISVGTAFNHIKTLEKSGVLKGYTVVLDPNRIGFSLTTLIMVQVEGGHLLDVEDEISKAPNVFAVYDITGDYDAAIIAKFKDRGCMNTFIKNLMSKPHVKRTVTSVVLEVIKEDLQIKIPESNKVADR